MGSEKEGVIFSQEDTLNDLRIKYDLGGYKKAVEALEKALVAK